MTGQANICWVIGGYFQRKDIISSILQKVGNPPAHIYDDVDMGSFQEEVCEVSMFDDNKVVIINNWPRYDGTKNKFNKVFLSTLKSISPNCVLIINNISSQSKKIFEYINSYGKVYKFETNISNNQASAFLEKFFKQHQKSISSQEINSILLSFGQGVYQFNVDQVYLVAQKILHFIGDRKVIKEFDILKTCNNNNEFVIWSLFSCFDNKDYISVSQLMKNLFIDDILKSIENLIQSSLWRYKAILLAKEAINNGISKKDVIFKIQQLSKIQQESSGLQSSTVAEFKNEKKVPIYSEKILKNLIEGNYYNKAAIEQYSRKQIFDIVRVLQSFLNKIRKGISEKKAKIILNDIFMLICDKISYSNFMIMHGL